MDYKIFPPEDLIETTVNLPVSKSFSNRLHIIKALAGEKPVIEKDSECDDVAAIAAGLNATSGSKVNVGAAGTAMRFLTAYFAIQEDFEIELDGSERMRERPIGPLVDALRELGADISYITIDGYPPLAIRGKKLKGGEITVKADVSSQFVSALMLVAPYMTEGLKINLEGTPVSSSYIKMTAAMMSLFGVTPAIGKEEIIIPAGSYTPRDIVSEPDWSAASYWAEIVALSAGFVTLPGLSMQSVQGDRAVARLFEPLGVTVQDSDEMEGIEMSANPEVHSRLNLDMADNPDLVQALAVTCALLNVPFTFTGVTTLRIKETDRLEALREELLKLGYIIEIENDNTISWDGRAYPVRELPVINTYNDHRMAMAFAPAALYLPGIVIRDVEVVNKSYPRFWEDLLQAGFTAEETAAENAPL